VVRIVDEIVNSQNQNQLGLLRLDPRPPPFDSLYHSHYCCGSREGMGMGRVGRVGMLVVGRGLVV